VPAKVVDTELFEDNKPSGSEGLVRQPATPMDLLSIALKNNAAIDVIERLAALQREGLARQAEIEFNEAMNLVQTKIVRVAPDLNNSQTRSKYASYTALDKVVRPVYSDAGFSLSFNTEDCPVPEYVRVVCYVSKGGHTRKYQVDMPADGKGAKGGDVMTKTHATGAAMSYGMRYLLKYIFNIAIGEDDTDGNLSNGWLLEKIDWIDNCRNLDELEKVFRTVYSEAKQNNSVDAMKALIAAKDKQKKVLAQ
jgi:hypothetical protein